MMRRSSIFLTMITRLAVTGKRSRNGSVVERTARKGESERGAKRMQALAVTKQRKERRCSNLIPGAIHKIVTK